jgi:hypothetical protein
MVFNLTRLPGLVLRPQGIRAKRKWMRNGPHKLSHVSHVRSLAITPARMQQVPLVPPWFGQPHVNMGKP